MEDDEEIQSHQSPATGSPHSSPSSPNRRIIVTMATPSQPQQSSPINTLALALPVQSGGHNKSNGGGREDCWSEGATAVLIDAWGERYLELSRGNLRQKHWKEVADIVSSREDYTKAPKTDIQCKNRIDTVKKKYKQEKAKIAAGAGQSTWIFFDKLDQLIGTTGRMPLAVGASGGTGAGAGGGVALNRLHVGIPVGIRSNQQKPQQQMKPQMMMKKNQAPRMQFAKPNPVESDSESEPELEPEPEPEPDQELSADSEDSFPPPPPQKRARTRREANFDSSKSDGKKGKWKDSMRELTQAILRLGEAYEQAESAKLQQVMEMEKQRMRFAKEMELQRMQFFMKTQLEISQLKLGRKGSTANPTTTTTTTTTTTNNNNNNNNHNSESSN